MTRSDAIIAQCERYSAHNYHPLPVVIERGEGAWVWDADGRKYLDCLSAYSAVNQGHCHPKIIAALEEQARKITITSRAFHNTRMGAFLEKLCRLAEMDLALPMNTGAEAVETAVKAARKWGYEVKGVPDNEAEIIVCSQNFHGRTMAAVSASSEASYRHHFGPFIPGFKWVPLGDLEALRNAITENTVAFIMEPIQGEGGIIIPPDGYLRAAKHLCHDEDVLFVLDEIQTGLARTGEIFCHQHEEGAKPDMLIVGKALGGGVYPVSAVLSSKDILGLFQPGDHGSTFGGNPLGAAVGEAALDVIVDEELAKRSKELGDYLIEELRAINTVQVEEIRGRGLFIGVEIRKSCGPARPFCEELMKLGVLTKETHEQVIRLAPPLVIEKSEIDWLVAQFRKVL
jgi:ornithine--oxo-acid transaminase